MDLEVTAHKVVDGTESRNLRTRSVPNYPTSQITPPYGIYIYMVRPTGYRIFLNVSTRFFFTVTCRHFTGHNTEAGASPKKRGSVAPRSLTRQGKPRFAERWRERRASETAEGD